MKKFTTLLAIIILMLVTKISFAQEASVKGFVIDENKNPLTAVSVSLFNSNDSSLVKMALTKENGSYLFQNIPDGLYFTTFSNTGYEKLSSSSFMLNNLLKYCCDTAIMIAAKKQLAEVVVAIKKPFIEAKMDKIILNVESSPVAAGATVFEVLEKSPGVYSDKDGNLSMQGKSGVQVMIDGRPTYMSKTDLTNLLKNMQANDVQSIELVTNPSAKYDASGNAGIINIKTKKNKNFGTNGSITAGIGYAKDLKANGSIGLNHRTEKMNIFGNYNYGYNPNGRNLDIERDITKSATTTHFSQSGYQGNESNNQSLKLGIDYNINKNNILGVLFSGYYNIENQHSTNTTLMSQQKGITDSSLNADNQFKLEFQNYSYNLNYKAKLDSKGQELSADVDYAQYHSDVNSMYRNYYFDKAKNELKIPFLAKNISGSVINIQSAKVDYINPLTSGFKLEAGTKATFINSDNDLKFASKNGNEWQNDPAKSNRFKYDENVIAAYVNTKKEWTATSLQIGVRAEYSNTKGNSINENKIIKRDYLDIFPSIAVNQKLSADQNLGISYSKRIQRPDYESLNPFVYLIDDYTYQKGNPFLNPQYTHSFQMTYLYKSTYFVQAGYVSINDVISEAILADTAQKALYQTTKNIDHQKMYRLTLSAPVQITNWWKTNNNINGMEMSFKSPNLEGQKLNASQFFVILNSSHNFKINKTIMAELSGKYTSPLVYGTLQLKSEYSVDAGISTSVLNKKGNLKFGATDIFNTKLQRVSSVYPGVNYVVRQKNETRVFRLTFNYNFGNSKVKEARNKTTGLEDEQSRLKS